MRRAVRDQETQRGMKEMVPLRRWEPLFFLSLSAHVKRIPSKHLIMSKTATSDALSFYGQLVTYKAPLKQGFYHLNGVQESYQKKSIIKEAAMYILTLGVCRPHPHTAHWSAFECLFRHWYFPRTQTSIVPRICNSMPLVILRLYTSL